MSSSVKDVAGRTQSHATLCARRTGNYIPPPENLADAAGVGPAEALSIRHVFREAGATSPHE